HHNRNDGIAWSPRPSRLLDAPRCANRARTADQSVRSWDSTKACRQDRTRTKAVARAHSATARGRWPSARRGPEGEDGGSRPCGGLNGMPFRRSYRKRWLARQTSWDACRDLRPARILQWLKAATGRDEPRGISLVVLSSELQ